MHKEITAPNQRHIPPHTRLDKAEIILDRMEIRIQAMQKSFADFKKLMERLQTILHAP